MSVKASLNGPNRRKQKVKTSSLYHDDEASITFHIRDIDEFSHRIAQLSASKESLLEEFGDVCFFNPYGPAGKKLLWQHSEKSGKYFSSFLFHFASIYKN